MIHINFCPVSEKNLNEKPPLPSYFPPPYLLFPFFLFSVSNGAGCECFDAVHSARTPGLLNCRIGGVVLRKRIRGGCRYRVGPGNGRLELDCLHLKMESEAGAIYSTLIGCSKSLKGEGNSSETS